MLEAITATLGLAVLGVFGWAFQISNRVTKVETQIEDLPKLINTQFAEVNRRLSRIERGMNGHLKDVE